MEVQPSWVLHNYLAAWAKTILLLGFPFTNQCTNQCTKSYVFYPYGLQNNTTSERKFLTRVGRIGRERGRCVRCTRLCA